MEHAADADLVREAGPGDEAAFTSTVTPVGAWS
jgi:hypothetical protein